MSDSSDSEHYGRNKNVRDCIWLRLCWHFQKLCSELVFQPGNEPVRTNASTTGQGREYCQKPRQNLDVSCEFFNRTSVTTQTFIVGVIVSQQNQGLFFTRPPWWLSVTLIMRIPTDAVSTRRLWRCCQIYQNSQPEKTSNHNQPGVHKNALEGLAAACRTSLIKTICSHHPCFISKSLLPHMDLVIVI